MSDRKQDKSLPRRKFLKSAGLTTGAAAAVLLTAPAKAVTLPEAKKSGYRETEHVRKYYELARF